MADQEEPLPTPASKKQVDYLNSLMRRAGYVGDDAAERLVADMEQVGMWPPAAPDVLLVLSRELASGAIAFLTRKLREVELDDDGAGTDADALPVLDETIMDMALDAAKEHFAEAPVFIIAIGRDERGNVLGRCAGANFDPDRMAWAASKFLQALGAQNEVRWVYVFGHPDWPRIKVGMTRDVSARLKSVATGIGHELRVIACWPFRTHDAAYDCEQQILAAFHAYRVGGEWLKA